jgi:hypothetical protein
METTEKIVEAYVRYVKKWATIPNIKCQGQFEVDLLAFDPVNIKRYHIESSISVSGGFSKLTGGSFSPDTLKQRTKQASQRRTVGYFRDRKFTAPGVLTELANYGFNEGNYERIIVTWGWTEDAKKQSDKANITLWHFGDMINEITGIADSETYFSDDTVRTLQLIIKALQERKSPLRFMNY